MKILIGRRRQRNVEKIKEKFQSLHQTVNNSTVTVFSRKEEELIVEESVTTDNTQTNITDGGCEIIFSDVFYKFINGRIPEEISQTESKLKIINHLVSQNEILLDLARKNNYDTFFNNLVEGVYREYLIPEEEKIIQEYFLIDFSKQEEFQLTVKDSLGNEFCKTKTFIRSKVKQGGSFIIKCPMDDSETTVKDGFSPNEIPYFFYKNMFTGTEVSIDVHANSLTLNNLKSIPILDIKIGRIQAEKYNPLYFEVINEARN